MPEVLNIGRKVEQGSAMQLHLQDVTLNATRPAKSDDSNASPEFWLGLEVSGWKASVRVPFQIEEDCQVQRVVCAIEFFGKEQRMTPTAILEIHDSGKQVYPAKPVALKSA